MHIVQHVRDSNVLFLFSFLQRPAQLKFSNLLQGQAVVCELMDICTM